VYVDGIEKERKKITLSIIISYVLGVILLLLGVAEISVTNYISGLLFVLGAIVAIKPTMNYLEQRLNFSLSKAANFFVVFCLVVVAFAAVPNDTSTTDSDNEAIAEFSDSISTQTTTLNSKMYTCNVVGINYECSSWSTEQYPEIELFRDFYVPLFSNDEKIWNAPVNKLAKLILDSGDNYTVRTGETLDLGQGYALETKQVDVEGQKVWFEFTYNGEYVTDEIVSLADGYDGTWNLEFDDIQGEDGIVVFRVHVNQVFQGAVDSIAQIGGLWLIDYANAETLKTSDKFGNYTLKEINSGVDESDLGSLVFEHNDNQDNIGIASSEIVESSEATAGEVIKKSETTKTSEASFQDSEWLAACRRNSAIVADDLNGYANAAGNTDYSSLATYTDLLYADSQTALDESNMYSVSPDLQSVKEEYEKAMVQANWCAVYTAIAINDINNGNTDDAITSMNQAAEALKAGNEHTAKVNRLLEEYN
jgi:S-layer protein (TIGR01567 family)